MIDYAYGDAAGNPNTACSLQFIGNATMVLRFGPFTLLTDPNFLHKGQYAYLGHGLVSRRLHDPALDIDQLPDIDAVLLSHVHGDHWDRIAKRGLDRGVRVITTPKAARALERQGFRSVEALNTWGVTRIAKQGQALDITAVPGAHATGFTRRLLPPVMGSVIEYEPEPGEQALRVYVSGDTVLIGELHMIRSRFPDIDVAVLHLGGTTLPGGMVVTMDGAAGARLVEILEPDRAVPVHYDDYTVFKSPLDDFEKELARRGLSDLLTVVPRGEIRPLARTASRRER